MSDEKPEVIFDSWWEDGRVYFNEPRVHEGRIVPPDPDARLRLGENNVAMSKDPGLPPGAEAVSGPTPANFFIGWQHVGIGRCCTQPDLEAVMVAGEKVDDLCRTCGRSTNEAVAAALARAKVAHEPLHRRRWFGLLGPACTCEGL